MSGIVLVAGAGPAGMAAAAAASEAGAQVLVVDDNSSPGGQIWRGYKAGSAQGQPHAAAFASLAGRICNKRIEVLPASRIVAQVAPQTLRVESESGLHDVRYDKLILATGARELFLPFPGWTLPGLMGAGGLQAMVKSGLPIAGKRVALCGSGPLLLAVAASLAQRGAHILGIFEQASFGRLFSFGSRLIARPGKILEAIRYRIVTRRIPYRTSSWIVGAAGDDRIRSITVSEHGSLREMACDYVGCGFHLVPNLELPRLLGCGLHNHVVAVDAKQQTSLPGVFAAGELTGIGGLDKALVEGEIAGRASVNADHRHLHAARDRYFRFAAALSNAFALRPELRALAEDATYVCRCEDVPYVALATRQSWRDAKLHTRCGMGSCQGRICGSATEFLFGWQNESVRPPLTPARVETLAAPAEHSLE